MHGVPCMKYVLGDEWCEGGLVTESGGEGVIECAEAGGDGRAECGESCHELLFGVVVLIEEGYGVKVVLLLVFLRRVMLVVAVIVLLR